MAIYPGEGHRLARRLITMAVSDYSWEEITQEVLEHQQYGVEALLFMTGIMQAFLDEESWRMIILQSEMSNPEEGQ